MGLFIIGLTTNDPHDYKVVPPQLCLSVYNPH